MGYTIPPPPRHQDKVDCVYCGGMTPIDGDHCIHCGAVDFVQSRHVSMYGLNALHPNGPDEDMGIFARLYELLRRT